MHWQEGKGVNMRKREVSKVHRWIETNVDRDQAALGFVIALLSSITIVVGAAFAVSTWLLG